MPGVSLEAFAKALDGAQVHPVNVDGECVGAVIVSGCEIHACVLPSARGRWFKREHATILDGVLRKYGVASTSATTDQGVAFVQRLGFRQFGSKWLKGLNHGN
jgi:hypothetical protein